LFIVIKADYIKEEYYISDEIGYIEFNDCINGQTYKVSKSDNFTDNKEELNILVDYYDCVNNKLTVPITSFSSYGYNNATIDDGLVSYISFNDATNNDSISANTPINSDNTFLNSSNGACFGKGGCSNFDGSMEISYNNTVGTFYKTFSGKNINSTICMLGMATSNSGYRTLYNTGYFATGSYRGEMAYLDTGIYELDMFHNGDSGSFTSQINKNVGTTKVWYCFSQKNSVNITAYVNGTQVYTKGDLAVGDYTIPFKYFTIGNNQVSEAFIGTIDEIVIWNRSLTGGEVTWLWNDGNLRNITSLNTTTRYLTINGTDTLGQSATYNISIYDTANNLINTTQYYGLNLVSFNNNSILYINSTDYLNIYNITTNASNQTNYNLSFYSINLTINVIDGIFNALISNAIINISNTTYNYLNISTLTTGSSIYYLNTSVNYSLNISKLGYIENFTIFNYTAKGVYTKNITLSNGGSIFLKDEQSEGYFNISSPSFITEYIYCDTGAVYSINITGVSLTYPLFCNTTKIKFVVIYPTDRYYRTILTNKTNISNTTIWLINLDTTQMIFNTFEIFDLTNEYHNISLYLTKNINFVDYFITGDYIDVEKKIGAYLMLGEQYTLHIESNEQPTRVFGSYTANEAGNKVIKLLELTTGAVPTGEYENNYWYVDLTNGTPKQLVVTYNSTPDLSVFNLQIYALNYSNNSFAMPIFNTNSMTQSGQIINDIPTPYENFSLLVKSTFFKTDGSKINFTTTEYQNEGRVSFILNMISAGYVTRDTVNWWGMGFVSVIALIFGALSSGYGAIIVVVVVIVLGMFKILGVVGAGV
jgi:hypothetical protein